jgi:sugar phosphate isomerase/epimerase
MSTLPLPSRRQFLATSAAGAAALGLGAVRARAADESPYGHFKVGAQSYSFRNFKLEPALKQYQTLGLKYAEFFNRHVPLDSTPAQIQAVLKLCQEYGVKPAAYGVQPFTKDHDANRKQFEFAKALGIGYLSADPSPDSFDSLDKLCDEYKIAIAIHPHGPQGRRGQMQLHRWYSAEVIIPAVKDHNPLIGTCIDTGHILRCVLLGKQLNPVDEIRLMGQRNYGLHLKDFDPAKKEEVIVGRGALDVPGVVAALRDVGFQGCISVEYEMNPDAPTQDIAEGLKVLRAAIEKVG